jgi:putative sterol carrier protein
MKNIKQTVAKMESRINDELAKKINRVCSIQIGTGDECEKWFIDFTIDKNRISQNTSNKDIACTIIVKNIDDWFSIIEGEINPTTAFMHGKVKIEGDISTALKMQTILSN